MLVLKKDIIKKKRIDKNNAMELNIENNENGVYKVKAI